MLIRFSLENFLSFRERQTLDMMAVRTCKERRDENTIRYNDKDSLLRSIALYGANASGKSNLFSAMSFCADFILSSALDRGAAEDICVIPFLYDGTSSALPSLFELEFTHGANRYRYGFSATSRMVVSEWLYAGQWDSSSLKPRFVRKRENDEDMIEVHPSFVGADSLIVEKTRGNALFLSTCAGLAVAEAEDILKEVAAWSFVLASQDRMAVTARMLEGGDCRDAVLRFVNMADPSIDDLQVERMEYDSGRIGADGRSVKRFRYRVVMKHSLGSGESMSLPLYSLGSLGTRKAFELAGPIFKALAHGAFIFIDELDSRLHPILTREIIKLFNSTDTNPKNAQLVFNTHDTNLLNCKVYSPSRDRREQLFRRDQVYFVERTSEYVSKMYSLSDFRDEGGAAVRNDASFEKEYLAGEYGAIPFIGNFDFGGTCEQGR